METLIPILAAAVRSGTPILYATLGEIMTEKSGVMNLGLEGVMLMGALSGFSATLASGSPWIGLAAAFGIGACLGLVHAFLSVSLGSNQVVCGLAMTMFGAGASALAGRKQVGMTIGGIGSFDIPILSNLPAIGRVFFSQDVMVYASFFLVFFLVFFLRGTRPGMNLRAVGDNPRAADAMGLSVARIRYMYTVLGTGLVALGGAYMSVVYNKFWAEGMTAGRGWIAVAMVIFAVWNPMQAALGAYLFGGVDAFQLRLQAAGTSVPAPLLMMLPYILTILVLVFISIGKGRKVSMSAPAALGQPFYREERD
ncbi:MAG: ABC transporter permease [Synergistaceae bacterium]|jgi:simple sugar transport system permease protein|nr:ABC transporter permease [Synergistaceae bacterium]